MTKYGKRARIIEITEGRIMTGLLIKSGISVLIITILSGCAVSDSNSNIQPFIQLTTA